ncbi:hypothetical protein KBI23_10595 [bacterium]|nr:hypothetical protein [bacterium]
MTGSFDFDKPLKQTPKVAEELLALLSNSIAKESINSNENQASEQESSAVHQQLSHLRLAKARRAYQKAKHAVTDDEYEEAIEHSRRGLLHVELARTHFNSTKTELSQLTAPAPQFAEGSCEESIQTLIEAITQIKLVVEYKKIVLNRRLQERLLDVVQSLQDAIESYGQTGASNKGATKLAECGQVWAQFIYGHFNNDELYSQKHPNKALRSLTSFAWQITTNFSSLTSSPKLKQTNQLRAQMHSIEKSLESALDAYMTDNTNDLEKYLRLGQIESQALKQYEVHTESSVQVSTEEQAPLNFNLLATESTSLREDLARMASLLKKHYPDAKKAETALDKLRQTLPQMKRSLKEEEWQQAARLLDMCESNTALLKNEIAKLDI